ncbi:MAG TPA: AMP-binding protein [Vicinamibacterales bacterium]|nr:AMP-binding protein [Vicinamibacterales bacterium]
MLRNARELLARRQGLDVEDKVAVIDGPARITYAELRERSHGFGALLRQRGIGPGDRVGIFLRRSIDAVAALFGTWHAGAVAVIVNDALRTRQVHHVLEHSEARCVITDTRQILAVPDYPCEAINVDDARVPAGSAAPARLIGADLAALIYTSGSTGLPKGVMLSHDNLLSGVQIVSQYLELTGRDVILSILPISFDYGLNQLLTSLFVGGRLVIQRSLFPPDICKTIRAEGVTGLAGVPTLWLQLTGRLSPFLRTVCPALRYITNSGGRLPEQTVRAIRAAHPHVRIYLMYGLTEAFRSTYLPPEEVDRRPSSMGKAIPGVDVLVVSEDGRRCAPGEIGELVHRGANICLGYWRDPESTSRVFRPHPLEQSRNGRTETVVFSGDLVKTDADGYLYYVGRKDMQVKSRGVRVSPEEIERCVYASSLVSHVVAFGVPRQDGDTDIVVAVVPVEPAGFDEGTLEEFCREAMPEYMWPREIWALPAFPLTSSGKPDRVAIRQLYGEHTGSPGTSARAARTA